jgi:acyl-CoA thioesterase YciA
MPKDTNAAGHIFGGWIMSQMDTAGSIVAVEYANSRVVTVAVTSIAVIVYVAVYKEGTPKPLPARGANFSHSF